MGREVVRGLIGESPRPASATLTLPFPLLHSTAWSTESPYPLAPRAYLEREALTAPFPEAPATV